MNPTESSLRHTAKQPRLSSRAELVTESPIRKLAPYAEQAEREGTEVYHLNIGQPDLPTPEPMRQAYRRVQEVVAYGPSQGLRSYREKLAAYYARYGVRVEPDEIFITNGGSEAIVFTLMGVTSPGDEIIVPEPYYANYNGFAAMVGAKIVPVPTTLEKGFHLPDIEEFERLITPRTRAILFSNPGNPTGAVFSRERLQELAELALRHGIFLISDEVYREFVYGDQKPVSILEFEELGGQAVLVDSVSKRYSACGARIGCLVTRNEALYDLVLRFGQARLCPPTVDQHAAEVALTEGDEYITAAIEEYRRRRDTAYRELSSLPGVNVPVPEGAFYMIAELPVEDAEDFALWLLRDFRRNGETVMVAPASGFYATEGAGRRQIRIAYVIGEEKLVRAIRLLGEALREYPG
jgi:aspartate aminotransferase